MKVNFDHQFMDDNGKPVRHGTKPAVFKDLAVQALLHAKGDSEGEPDAKEKRHRYDLAVRIQNFGSECLLNESDVNLLKAVMGNAYHTLVSGPAQYLLDGQEVPAFKITEEPNQVQ